MRRFVEISSLIFSVTGLIISAASLYVALLANEQAHVALAIAEQTEASADRLRDEHFRDMIQANKNGYWPLQNGWGDAMTVEITKEKE